MKCFRIIKPVYIGLFLIVIYISPWVIKGPNFFVPSWDNLDGILVYIKILIDKNLVFASPVKLIDNVMNGITRGSLGYSLHISMLFFSLFGMYWGYVVNKLIVMVIGFFGMQLLLKKFIGENNSKLNWIVVIVSTAFAFLPFWSFDVTVAGIPFLFYCFGNLYERKKKGFEYLFIAFYAFYSLFVVSGLFILIALTLILSYHLIKTKKISLDFLLGIFLLGFLYIISHWGIFYNALFKDYISHRTEFNIVGGIGIWGIIKSSANIFLFGHGHAQSFHTLLIVPIFLFFIIIILKKEIFTHKLLLLTMVFLVLTSLWYGLFNSTLFIPYRNLIYSTLPMQLDRFYMLHPMLWYLLFGYSCMYFMKSFKIKHIEYIVIFISLIPLINNTLKHPIKFREALTFKKYYSTNTFSKIKIHLSELEKDNEFRVGSIGLDPMIAAYNGLKTIDGYASDYPLEYKHKFRKIIKGELEKDENLKKYFDEWGSRCYLFTSEIKSWQSVNPDLTLNDLDFNFNQMLKLNCKYILTRVKIREERLTEICSYSSPGELTINVYKINETNSLRASANY